MAIRALFMEEEGPSVPIFSTLQRFSVLRTSKRCFPTPATIIFPFRFHARHWLWIRLGLKAAVGQTKIIDYALLRILIIDTVILVSLSLQLYALLVSQLSWANLGP